MRSLNRNFVQGIREAGGSGMEAIMEDDDCDVEGKEDCSSAVDYYFDFEDHVNKKEDGCEEDGDDSIMTGNHEASRWRVLRCVQEAEQDCSMVACDNREVTIQTCDRNSGLNGKIVLAKRSAKDTDSRFYFLSNGDYFIVALDRVHLRGR